MLEALLAADVARLEAQAREPVAADELVAAAGGRDEHEPAGHGRVAGRVDWDEAGWRGARWRSWQA